MCIVVKWYRYQCLQRGEMPRSRLQEVQVTFDDAHFYYCCQCVVITFITFISRFIPYIRVDFSVATLFLSIQHYMCFENYFWYDVVWLCVASWDRADTVCDVQQLLHCGYPTILRSRNCAWPHLQRQCLFSGLWKINFFFSVTPLYVFVFSCGRYILFSLKR